MTKLLTTRLLILHGLGQSRLKDSFGIFAVASAPLYERQEIAPVAAATTILKNPNMIRPPSKKLRIWAQNHLRHNP
jgi:hypothetical protein